MTLIGHRGEISLAQFNWDCSFIVTGSMDKSVKVRLIERCQIYEVPCQTKACMVNAQSTFLHLSQIWDATTGKCVATLTGHQDEVLDVAFDLTGQHIASASADGTARVR